MAISSVEGVGSISTTRMANENYGFMAPVKAALDSSLAMLAKSFSRFSEVRFNAVAHGLLKTSSSAGIPGYVDAYLYAEQVIPRHRAVQTEEAAATAVFLLSPRSSGINAQQIIVDAGMSINYFDKESRAALSRTLEGFGGIPVRSGTDLRDAWQGASYRQRQYAQGLKRQPGEETAASAGRCS